MVLREAVLGVRRSPEPLMTAWALLLKRMSFSDRTEEGGCWVGHWGFLGRCVETKNPSGLGWGLKWSLAQRGYLCGRRNGRNTVTIGLTAC